MINILDATAHLNENVPEAYRGLTTAEARAKVLEDVKAAGLFVKEEDNPMTIPYGDRSGVVIEPWLTDQWFVDAPKLAVEAIKVVEDGRMQFVPKAWEKHILNGCATFSRGVFPASCGGGIRFLSGMVRTAISLLKKMLIWLRPKPTSIMESMLN